LTFVNLAATEILFYHLYGIALLKQFFIEYYYLYGSLDFLLDTARL